MDDDEPTFGQRCAEAVANTVGSWKFIIIQTIVLITWVILNGSHVLMWDLYPFILMNLFLSLQAAYTAPMILMSQNRQNEKDRKILYEDYRLDHSTHTRLDKIEETLEKIIKYHEKE